MQAGTVLLVDASARDSPSKSAAALAEILSSSSALEVRREGASAALPRKVGQAKADLVFLVGRFEDLLPYREGLKDLRGRPDGPAFLAIPEKASSRQVLRLLRWGVSDFVQPPLARADVLARVQRCQRPACQDDELVRDLTLRMGLRPLIGKSPRFLAVLRKIPLVARCDATLLICGETGTGKELCARAVHYSSPRSRRPFVPVNCGAIPVELVENELFGHERMAYTGASEAAAGLLEEAQGGTLFLDEIDSLPKQAQVKLLRLLQEKEYRRLGSSDTRRADLRVIAATNQDPRKALSEGRMREDLYYRLSAVPLELPPLRRRRDDIPELARHFLAKFAAEQGKRPMELCSDAALRLRMYDWPGNIRELENILERAVIFCQSPRLRACDLDLPDDNPDAETEPFQKAKARVVGRFERDYIESLLAASQGNITQAARKAHKNRRAFFELIRKHGIDVGRFRS